MYLHVLEGLIEGRAAVIMIPYHNEHIIHEPRRGLWSELEIMCELQ